VTAVTVEPKDPNVPAKEPNLPATRGDAPLAERGAETTALVEHVEEEPAPFQPRQDLTVALLPLALITLLTLSFIAAAWTFLAAT
jgi:hypothetical protein